MDPWTVPLPSWLAQALPPARHCRTIYLHSWAMGSSGILWASELPVEGSLPSVDTGRGAPREQGLGAKAPR